MELKKLESHLYKDTFERVSGLIRPDTSNAGRLDPIRIMVGCMTTVGNNLAEGKDQSQKPQIIL